ncbi:SNase-like nuclease [Pontibacter diazotrophicus]|uniref:SNase-like nuclease n=1 Tax=Pontibacter diazotrophicus TaxID=1400979 RepID=A0A3D8LF33_9BACT|nr:thermonuclease family protein [Pontibacter diazotrophicus]RDV16008.1 SNase-like nuclease [Pontibacter diazotrophicus]
MRKNFHFLLVLLLCASMSCKQSSREEAQEQFRQRQEAILERNENQSGTLPAETTEEGATTVEEAEETAPARPATTAGDKVIGIKDGDTIELLRNGQSETVRLYGVDTPEKKQAYGERAKQFTSDLVFGKTVRLITHNKDRYGRTVGTIMLPDGRSLNEELIKNGYAWHYTAYSKDNSLANSEADARQFKRGLWQDPNPVAPWDFRKEKRSGSTTTEASVNTTPLPAGASKRTVYLCNSNGSAVYHLTKTCHVLKRCKQDILAVTEAAAIQEYDRRADKTCSNL